MSDSKMRERETWRNEKIECFAKLFLEEGREEKCQRDDDGEREENPEKKNRERY